jgi:hypothetical protein
LQRGRATRRKREPPSIRPWLRGPVSPTGFGTEHFLEEHNSGHPSTKGFDTDIDKGYVFNSLYSYNPDDANSIYRTYECVFKGTDLYPIAIEASGNTVCFDLNRKQLVL